MVGPRHLTALLGPALPEYLPREELPTALCIFGMLEAHKGVAPVRLFRSDLAGGNVDEIVGAAKPRLVQNGADLTLCVTATDVPNHDREIVHAEAVVRRSELSWTSCGAALLPMACICVIGNKLEAPLCANHPGLLANAADGRAIHVAARKRLLIIGACPLATIGRAAETTWGRPLQTQVLLFVGSVGRNVVTFACNYRLFELLRLRLTTLHPHPSRDQRGVHGN